MRAERGTVPAHTSRRVRAELAGVLREGLKQRVGMRLTRDEEKVFIHLATRVISGGNQHYKGLRVCEWCLLVFDSPRAKRCAECRDKGRWTPRPHHETAVMFGQGNYRELQFVGECAETGCTARFQSADVRTRYCHEHGTPAAYTHRSRESHLAG